MPTNLNTNSNEASNSNHPSDLTETFDFANQIVSNNYLSNEILHHQLGKKLDVSYPGQSKEHQSLLIYNEAPSPSTTLIAQPPLLNLTPKYTVEYQGITSDDVQQNQFNIIAATEESDKSDCESDFMSTKKQNLPHKKRIAKKLNSNQSYLYVIPGEESRGGVVATAQFECNICGVCFADQLQFFVHLKEHYEPAVEKVLDKRQDPEMEVKEVVVPQNVIDEVRFCLKNSNLNTPTDSCHGIV